MPSTIKLTEVLIELLGKQIISKLNLLFAGKA